MNAANKIRRFWRRVNQYESNPIHVTKPKHDDYVIRYPCAYASTLVLPPSAIQGERRSYGRQKIF